MRPLRHWYVALVLALGMTAAAAAAQGTQLVVVKNGVASLATLSGAVGQDIATGGIRGASVSPAGTLWLASRPSERELSSLNPDYRPYMCGFTRVVWPWPSTPVNIGAVGATWPAKMLTDAAPHHSEMPTCEIAATPEDALAFTRMPVGSGTRSLVLRPSTTDNSFSVSSLGCGWSVTFSVPGGPVACLYHAQMGWGSAGYRVFTGQLNHVRGASSRQQSATGAGISPDGRRVVLLSDSGVITVAKTNGRQARRIGTVRGARGRVLWTPDGTTIIIRAGSSLWKMAVSGRRPPVRFMSGVDDVAVMPQGLAP